MPFLKFSRTAKLFLEKWHDEGEKHFFLSLCSLFLMCLFFLFAFGTLENWHLTRDGCFYLRAAEEAVGKYYFEASPVYVYPPLLVMIMVHLNHWFGISCRFAGFLFCMICGALCPVLIFTGVYKIFRDYWLALLSGVLFFLIPGIRDVSVSIWRDTPALCMNLAGLCSFIYYRKNSLYRFIFSAGLFFVFALGFRYENIEFLLMIPILSAVLEWQKKGNTCIVSEVKSVILSWSCFTAGVFFGAGIIYLICLKSNFYSLERFLLIFQTYFHFS